MPKAKPVSLHPLNFDEAVKALIGVNPTVIKPGSKPVKSKQKRKPRTKSPRNNPNLRF